MRAIVADGPVAHFSLLATYGRKVFTFIDGVRNSIAFFCGQEAEEALKDDDGTIQVRECVAPPEQAEREQMLAEAASLCGMSMMKLGMQPEIDLRNPRRKPEAVQALGTFLLHARENAPTMRMMIYSSSDRHPEDEPMDVQQLRGIIGLPLGKIDLRCSEVLAEPNGKRLGMARPDGMVVGNDGKAVGKLVPDSQTGEIAAPDDG